MNIKKMKKTLGKFNLDVDNDYNIVCLTNPIPQLVYTKTNLQVALECSMELILEDYKIPYKNSDIQLYASTMVKSWEKLEQYNNKIISIANMLITNIESNYKSEVDNCNYILSNGTNISWIDDISIMFHQMDFNLRGVVMDTLLGLRIFLLAHYSVILNKKIEIKTDYNTFNLISDIEMEKVDDEQYIFTPKIIELQEK